jgi:hypothetical protein
MEQNPIRPRKGSWDWLLIGAVVLAYLSALVAPSFWLMLYPSDIVALPPLYPDIFPHAPVMMIVGGLFIVIALLTMHPTRGGARIALVSIAAIMTVYVWWNHVCLGGRSDAANHLVVVLVLLMGATSVSPP